MDKAAAATGGSPAEDDERPGTNPVLRLFRYLFQERLRATFAPGSRVLVLACHRCEEGIFLASRGIHVVGLDARGDLPSDLEGPFDGACSGFGALDSADLKLVGRRLTVLLRPEAPVVLDVPGRHPLPAMIERALTAQEGPRAREPLEAPASDLTRRQAEAELGSAFQWAGGLALGVLIPGPAHGPWTVTHPQAFAALAALESLVRHWPVLRNLGHHIVLEGRRRRP